MVEILMTLQCPKCNEIISGVIPERSIPRIRAELLINIKKELLSGIESKTGWGKNQLAEFINTVIDSNIKDI